MDGEISENFLRIISISGLLRDERKSVFWFKQNLEEEGGFMVLENLVEGMMILGMTGKNQRRNLIG